MLLGLWALISLIWFHRVRLRARLIYQLLFHLRFFSVRFIPDWVPGSGFKHLPPGTREALTAMREVPFNYVKEKMVRSPNGASYY